MLTRACVVCSVASFLLCAGALAQSNPVMSFPAAETGAPTVQTVFQDGRVRITDADDGTVIVANRDRYPLFGNLGAGVTGSVEVQNQPGGCDLRYTFVNTGAEPSRLGTLNVGLLDLGNNVTYQNFSHVGEAVAADYNHYGYQGFQYPSTTYAPVWVLRNARYAVGISLQYPIMEYQHDCRVMLGSSAIDDPRGWFVQLLLSNIGDETPWGRLKNSAVMRPGESRTYIVSIRITRNPGQWIRTLVPYRDYFRASYGGVTYERDAREIYPLIVGMDEAIGANNPYGFASDTQRPDLHGFKPLADAIKSQHRFSRVVLWAPTGVYDAPVSRQFNYPYQFTSRWLSLHMPSDAAGPTDSANGLASVHPAGYDLGLWWGRSLQVARQWNPTGMENFDPDNPEHVAAAFAEMDLAVQAGATMVGLDTYLTDMTPLWKAYPWLQAMRQRYPNVKFCTEPRNCDIMHSLAATFILAWPGSPLDSGTMDVPFYLADFLLPGHETWAMMGYQGRRSHGMPVTQDVIQADADRIAGLGYVPVIFQEYLPAAGAHQAAESWLASVPADLLHGSGWNTNFNRGRTVRGADGRLHIIAGSVPDRSGGSGGGSPGHSPAPAGTRSGAGPGGTQAGGDDAGTSLALAPTAGSDAPTQLLRGGSKKGRGGGGGGGGGSPSKGAPLGGALAAASAGATSSQLSALKGGGAPSQGSSNAPGAGEPSVESGPINNPMAGAGFFGGGLPGTSSLFVPSRTGAPAAYLMNFDRASVRRALEAARGRAQPGAIQVLTSVPDLARE